MNLELKEFQEKAVGTLIGDLQSAKAEILARGRAQALTLSAPTASGKTVIITSVIEKILGGDGGLSEDVPFDPEPNAVFLWLSDQPELNRQSRARVSAATNRLREHDLVIVESDFDAEVFDGGKVFFLNSQKLGKDKLLTRYGDGRHWTIWETIRNTQSRQPDSFYVIVDEAHRGMNVYNQEREQANSIIQKFIIGSRAEHLPALNLIIGMSATPDRFNAFLQGKGRTTRSCDIEPADVRASGLIKDRIILHPKDTQPSPWTLLAEACRGYTSMADEWKKYCVANVLPSVDPALIVQIEDGTSEVTSRTDLEALVTTLEENIPGLMSTQIVHCLQEDKVLEIAGRRIRYANPSTISGDASVRVVIFKMALTTGWDCPRAEVMISFRRGQDATYIAQLVGRMVRTPLAERIAGNERLNDVFLFLPFYDEKNLESIVDRLTKDRESVPATTVTTSKTAGTFQVKEAFKAVVPALRRIPTYRVSQKPKTSNIRRLMKLTRLLSQDGIDSDAKDQALSSLVAGMVRSLEARLRNDSQLRERIEHLQTVTSRTVILRAGDATVPPGPAPPGP